MKSRFGVDCCCSGGGSPTQPCGACNIPLTLTLTWRYRSYVGSPFGPPGCPPIGAGITTLTLTLTFVAGHGWVSGYFQLADHGYCGSIYPADLGYINPANWCRLAVICVSGTLRLWFEVTATQPQSCYPGETTFPCSTLGQRSDPMPIISCSPFHAGFQVSDGVTYSEAPGRVFEDFELTE